MAKKKQTRGVGKEAADYEDTYELEPGSVKRGKSLFKKHCIQCHSIYPDGRLHAGSVGMGPTLFDCWMRTAGMTNTGRINLVRHGGMESGTHLWTAGSLMNYMKNPRAATDGPVQMNFEGLPDVQKRIDIIHYIKTLNWDNPEVATFAERPSSWPPVRYYQKWKESRAAAKA